MFWNKLEVEKILFLIKSIREKRKRKMLAICMRYMMEFRIRNIIRRKRESMKMRMRRMLFGKKKMRSGKMIKTFRSIKMMKTPKNLR